MIPRLSTSQYTHKIGLFPIPGAKGYLILLLTVMMASCSKPTEFTDFTNPYDEQGTAYIAAPDLNTVQLHGIRALEAWSGGEFTSDYGKPVTAKGVCWSTEVNPTIGDDCTNEGSGLDAFESHLAELEPDQTYYVRAYATNDDVTIYGSQRSFRTSSGSVVTDIDGNQYETVRIGDQEWLAENLKVKRYRNGDTIPSSPNALVRSGSWVYFNNESDYADTYGLLYNWYAATDSRGLCPNGWKLPSEQDWNSLVNFLGGSTVAGGKMKSPGTVFWNSPNINATNESGFNALPGGFRALQNAAFGGLKSQAVFWSSNLERTGIGLYRSLQFNNGSVSKAGGDIRGGYSVRCIRR